MKQALLISIFCCPSLFANPIKDFKITQDIKQKLSIYNQNGLDVNVATHHGVVTLVGDVNSVLEANILIEIAETVPGVQDVHASQLTINLGRNLSEDEIITAKIRGAFVREQIFGEMIADIPLNIETIDGVVHLEGKVSQKEQLDSATKLIHTISGVKNVVEKVTLSEVAK